MNTAYEASPECAERRCRITRIEDIATMRHIFHHGDNPEAVMFVDRISCFLDPSAEIRKRFREWAERIHRYEDGEVAPPDQEESTT